MKSITQSVILAGGLGTRMQPLTFSTPKPMIRIHGKPFLEYIINLLRDNGIQKVLILTGYLHEQIEEYFKDGKRFDLSISYSYSPVGDDTGTRIKKARELIQDKFLLLYSDNYWPLQLDLLTRFYKRMRTKASVVVYNNRDNVTKNNMLVDDKGFIQIYDRSRVNKNLNAVDIGFFLLDRNIFTNLPKKNFAFEDVVLPRLIKKRQLGGFLTDHKYYSLTNPGRIPAIEKYLSGNIRFLSKYHSNLR